MEFSKQKTKKKNPINSYLSNSNIIAMLQPNKNCWYNNISL